MRLWLFLGCLCVGNMLSAQQDYRTWLRGKVLYQDSNVVAANVLNTTSEKATITDDNGNFAIEVQLNDELIFSSVQYEIRAIVITKEILQRNRLVIDVREKITQLDEVVISPNRPEAFLNVKEEEFKQFDYTADKSTRVENELLRQNQLYNGVDFVNIFKLLYKSLRPETSEDKTFDFAPSDVIRQIYPDIFFTSQLNIDPDEIELFLQYCDDRIETKDLLKRENEFQLMDFLIKQSEKFRKAR
ncbi:MAG: carboxypeptidase-like regulatory domain-containing protein [Flavobacteriaceae bacterium]